MLWVGKEGSGCKGLLRLVERLSLLPRPGSAVGFLLGVGQKAVEWLEESCSMGNEPEVKVNHPEKLTELTM